MSKPFKAKGKASSSRAPQPASGTFGVFAASSLGSERSILSFILEPLPLDQIHDPNIVVEFKGLTKKDPTTKLKALQQLQILLLKQSKEGIIEDGVIDSWAKIYPRLSIDNDRKVRELSHSLHADPLIHSSNDRLIYMHSYKSIPCWLASLDDKDNSMKELSKKNIKSVFPNVKKLLKLRQSEIVKYALNAIQETPDSLSDERNVSPDDSMAMWYRVAGSSLFLITTLLSALGEADRAEYQVEYEKFLSNEKVWSLIQCEDAWIRRHVYSLFESCNSTSFIQNHLKLMSTTFISSALGSPQSTTATALLEVLQKFSTLYPEIFILFKSKKPFLIRFEHFISQGSQDSTEYWPALVSTLQHLPSEIIPSESKGVGQFLDAYHLGTRQRNDLLRNADNALISYIQALRFFFDRATNDDYLWVIAMKVGVIISEYLYESPAPRVLQGREKEGVDRFSTHFYLNDLEMKSYQENARPLAESFKMYTLKSESFRLNLLMVDEHKFWRRVCNPFTEPGSSPNNEAFQNETIQIARRWFTFVGEVWNIYKDWEKLVPIGDMSFQVIKIAISALEQNNGKPYSCAAVIEAAIIHVPELARLPKVSEMLQGFIREYIRQLIVSPSSPFIIRIMLLMDNLQTSEDADSAMGPLSLALNEILRSSPGIIRERNAIALLSNFRVDQAQKNSRLQDFLLRSAIENADDDVENIPIIKEALITECMSQATADSIINHMVETLARSNVSSDVSPVKALKTLHILAQSSIGWESLKSMLVDLTVQLLKYSGGFDEDIAAEAALLRALIYKKDPSAQLTVGVAILNCLKVVGNDAAPISVLVTIARDALSTSDDPIIVESFFPDNLEWVKEIELSSSHRPDPALDIMEPFTGVLNLVEWSDSKIDFPQIDTLGYSSLMRKTLYVSSLFEFVAAKDRKDILFNLGLMTEMVNDKMSLRDGDNLFEFRIGSDRDERIQEFLKSNITRVDAIDEFTDIDSLVQTYVRYNSRNALISYYASKSLCRLMHSVGNLNKVPYGSIERWPMELNIFKTPTDNKLKIAAVLKGLKNNLHSSLTVGRLCNEAVADVISTTSNSAKTLQHLVLLSSCLGVYEKAEKLPVGEHRSMRVIDHILSWDLDSLGAGVAAESCRILQRLSRFHHEYRAASELDLCLRIWSRITTDSLLDDDIPVLQSSLELYFNLEGRAKRTAYTDGSTSPFHKEFKDSTPKVYAEILRFLKLERDETHIFREQIDDQLLKVISSLDTGLGTEGPYDLYPLLASTSTPVQSAAYYLLHKSLPEKQIEVSLASESEDSPPPNLEDELISFVISAPKVEDLDDDQNATYPTSTRSYLLAWILIFESFPLSTLKVRAGYIEHLKRERCIDNLLPFIFDVLADKSADHIKLESLRFNSNMIRSYDLWEAISPEYHSKEMIWMVSNIYFLALSHASQLVKSWFINEAPKQVRISLEKWTENYMSPALISDALEDALAWGKNQDILQVKISRTTREVSAIYTIDESELQFMIRIPAIYPLGHVDVLGENTVIKQQKWNGILHTTKAVAEFSNKSLSEALDVYRKNIESAMKGVTECAICYSIVSADKKFPDKKCSTCNNKFHGQCLYKWFMTSNQNSCPLCRNQWAYGR